MILAAAQPNTTTAGITVAEKTRATPISKRAKEELHRYFAAMNWPLTHRLPQENYASDLNEIVEKYRLRRSQVTLQLIDYKNARYGLL